MTEDQGFRALHLETLINYVIPIVDGALDLGSGVLVNVRGRHFVATARHCIDDAPKAMKSVQRMQWQPRAHLDCRDP